VQQLVQRYQREGPSAFLPRSRRSHDSPHAVAADVEEMIIRLRKELSKQGLDACRKASPRTWPAASRRSWAAGAGGIEPISSRQSRSRRA
jgi:hypothetical protein